MMAVAREVILVADSSKFEQQALAFICSLDKIDQIITDDGLDPSVRRLYGSRLSIVPVSRLDGMSSRNRGTLAGGVSAYGSSATKTTA